MALALVGSSRDSCVGQSGGTPVMSERGSRLPGTHQNAILSATQSGTYYSSSNHQNQSQGNSNVHMSSSNPTTTPSNQEIAPDRPIGYGAFGVVW